MRIGLVVICDSFVSSQDVMAFAGVLLAHRSELEFVRAIGLHPLGAQYWDALTSNSLFSSWVEPIQLLDPRDNRVEALARAAVGGEEVVIAVAPLARISYEDVLQFATKLKNFTSLASIQVPHLTADQTSSTVCFLTGDHSLFGLQLGPATTATDLIDELAVNFVKRQRMGNQGAGNISALLVVDTPNTSILDPGMPLDLTVVVPTLNASSRRFGRFYRSLYETTDAPFQLVVVDNGKSAQGFSDPVNAGIRACTTRYVVVVNDDVVFKSGWWAPLRKALQQGAWVVFPLTDSLMRKDFAAWCFALDVNYLDQFAHSSDELFDPELRIWFQDSDLYLKLLQLGKPPQMVPESLIAHEFSATVGGGNCNLEEWIHDVVVHDKEKFVERWGIEALATVGFLDSSAVM